MYLTTELVSGVQTIGLVLVHPLRGAWISSPEIFGVVD